MREIEFRAWDKKNNFMFFDGFNDWGKTKIETHDYLKITLGGKVVRQMRYVDSNASLSRLEDWTGDYIVMQYTGLKDKNGKKIFEGDYLEDYRGFKYEVKRVQGGFGINTFANEFGKKWTFWTATSDMQTSGYIKESCEVVGNIFENTIEE